MTWMLLFCAWGAKAGGCITPVSLPSKRACEFVLRHQTDVARRMEKEWSGLGMIVTGRCVGFRP